MVTNFDLAQSGLGDCEGLGFDASRNTLLAVDLTTESIYELSVGGEHLRTFDLAAIMPPDSPHRGDHDGAELLNPNDSPAALNYWVVDRHIDNKANPNENDGLLYSSFRWRHRYPRPRSRCLSAPAQTTRTRP